MVAMPRKVRTSLIAAAVLVGIAGCSGTGNVDTSVSGSIDGQGGGGGISIYKSADRSMVGDVTGTTLQGKPLSLASYRGKFVVVDFWSDICVPCQTEEPGMEQLSKDYASKNVAFVGIDEQDNLASGQSFERQFKVTYPSLFDRTDAYVLDFPGAAPPSTPTTIVIDPQGGIAARVSGALDFTELQKLIDTVRSEPA
jgi:thiol-disulfide isomerase/thioredoxin